MQFFLSSINSLFDHYHISVSVMIQFHNKKRNGHVIQIFVYELNQLKYWNFQWRKRTANCYLYPIKVTRFDINKWNEKAPKKSEMRFDCNKWNEKGAKDPEIWIY